MVYDLVAVKKQINLLPGRQTNCCTGRIHRHHHLTHRVWESAALSAAALFDATVSSGKRGKRGDSRLPALLIELSLKSLLPLQPRDKWLSSSQ